MKTRQIAWILVLCMAVAAVFPAAAEEAVQASSQSLIERIAVSYAANGTRDEEALSSLDALDPSLGEKWTRIMDLWEAPVTVNEALPDGLPEDDSLCLVGLGFQLNPDGTMREELIERLKVMLAASEKYPNAVIVCTGGGTAADEPSATEAGRMAEWLEAQGVNPSRLVVEDRSLTTAQNAVYTFDILEERYPQVKRIAIISSDYHIATGMLLFGAEAILRDSDAEVAGNAAWHAPAGSLSILFQAGALIELSGDVETAFEIYYETYDIHELPPLPAGERTEQKNAYTLDKVIVLSRHNIRSPLTGGGSLLGEITPHSWFDWTSDSGELSLKGAVLETMMGQYFRLWLEDEGLIPANWHPEENAVRFYANAKQRTQATARYFSAGFLPVSVVPIEMHAPYDTMDETFTPKLHFVSDAYNLAVQEEIAAMGGEKGMAGYSERLKEAIMLLMDITDMGESEAYRSGKYGNLLEDENIMQLDLDQEPRISGPVKTAASIADALKFQYYEEPDALKAAFGHELTRDDWLSVCGIVETYGAMLFSSPLVAVNAAHPLLQEIKSELELEDRKFCFLCGHDSNIVSVLAALGAGDYSLPNTLEPKTPIGVKLAFERYLDADENAWYRIEMIYQDTEQLRSCTALSLENPPMRAALTLKGVQVNEDGLIAEEDLLNRFREAVDAYDLLLEEYAEAEEAA